MVPERFGDGSGRQNGFPGFSSPDERNQCVTPETAPYEEHPRRSMVKSVHARENHNWMACQQEQLDELDDMFKRYKRACGRVKSKKDSAGSADVHRANSRQSLAAHSFDEVDENVGAGSRRFALEQLTARFSGGARSDRTRTPSRSSLLGRVPSPEEDDDVLKEALVAAQNVMEDRKSPQMSTRPGSGLSGISAEDMRSSLRSVRSYRDEPAGHYKMRDWDFDDEFGWATSRSARSTTKVDDRSQAYHRSDMAARRADLRDMNSDMLLSSNPLELELYGASQHRSVGKTGQQFGASSSQTSMTTPMRPRGPRKATGQPERRARRASYSVYSSSTPVTPVNPKKKGGPGIPLTTAIRTPQKSSSLLGLEKSKNQDASRKFGSAVKPVAKGARSAAIQNGPAQRLPRKGSADPKQSGKFGPPQRVSTVSKTAKFDSGMSRVPYTKQGKQVGASPYGPPQRCQEVRMGTNSRPPRDEATTLKPRSSLPHHRLGVSGSVKVRHQAGY